MTADVDNGVATLGILTECKILTFVIILKNIQTIVIMVTNCNIIVVISVEISQ